MQLPGGIDKDLAFLMLDGLREAVLLTDLDLKIIYVNPQTLVLTKYNEQDLIGKNITQFISHDREFESKVKIAKKDGSRVYTYVKTSDEKTINCRVKVSEIVGSSDHHVSKYLVLHIKDNTKSNFLDKQVIRKTLTIESLSRSRRIRDGFLNEAIYEILEKASRATGTQRVNAWIFNERFSEIRCIGNYDGRENKMMPQESLPRIIMPKYFSLFETEKIILSNDAFNDKKLSELLDFYLVPHNIRAMMDIPIRIEGDIVGVICFEHIHEARIWTIQDQQFGLIAAQLISLALESNDKKIAQRALVGIILEKETLLKEIHHRVKNNFAIMISLVNLQAEKAKDQFHKSLFVDTRNRLISIASVHESLYRSKSFTEINFRSFLLDLLQQLNNSLKHPDKNIIMNTKLEDVDLNISYAIPLSLIVNELITNCYKHAFKGRQEGKIDVELSEDTGLITLVVRDDGIGLSKDVKKSNSLGLEIYRGLLQQIRAKETVTVKNGTEYKIIFTKDETV